MSTNLRSRKTNGAANRNGETNGHTNGYTNGHTKEAEVNGNDEKAARGTVLSYAIPTEYGQAMDRKLDTHQSYEFGGPVGVTAMMIGFPILMYYLFVCLWYYDGKLVHPSSMADVVPFLGRMWAHVKDGAYPTKFAWGTYLGLTAIQLFFAWVMPGVDQNGLPVPSLDYAVLPYKCNALASWYTTIILAGVLHVTGIYRLPWIIENYGGIMTVAIATSFTVSAVIEILARTVHYGGAPLRMSGVWVYDHFMGVSLNPRLGPIDLKMFAEVRVPWVLLFLISLSGAVKQYEDLGYVTYNMCHMLLATALYINACAKGEELIPQTWDMFHEKFGWMLIFWNMAGVPFTYCYPVIYMTRSDPTSYSFPLWGKILMLVTLLTGYYIFDSSMAQKSAFKLQQQGHFKPRGAFPTVPWSVVENPKFIQTKHGNKLLTDGWWQYARKINYTADWCQAFTWGASAGFNTPITMFYPVFFLAVLTHRCGRDFEKCAAKYGDDWDEYCKIVKWRFIPYIY